MSRVVHRPTVGHSCSPGWTYMPERDDMPAGRYGIPPTARDYPRGTVWECDCGATWVSRGMCGGGLQRGGGYASAALEWKREGRWARRRRIRRAA